MRLSFASISIISVSSTFANSIDKQFLSLAKNIIENGEKRVDRTETGTLAVFAPPPLVFDVSHEAFPFITTKKVSFKLIASELLFFLSGSSHVEDLQKQGNHIWDANAKNNADNRAGFYSQAWRYFGATEFSHEREKMEAQIHVDQIANVIYDIMHNPTSRRLYVTAWDPLNIAIHPDVLPPCHVSMQFYVQNNGLLDMQVYQRSSDVLLGLPFNLASYGLLLLMIAHVTNKTAGKLTYVLGDSHIYLNHLVQIKEQLARKPFPLPQLLFETDIPKGSGLEGLLSFKYEDFKLINYQHHPPIYGKMSV